MTLDHLPGPPHKGGDEVPYLQLARKEWDPERR